MSYYKECPICGAALDPCERCDCETKSSLSAGTESATNNNQQLNCTTLNRKNQQDGGKMKLLNLNLTNFQGIKSAEFVFNGKSASIYGDNATGKTTIFNAFTWLLFDKPSTGAKNFTPKTKGKDGDMHNLEHSAEATFQTAEGRVLTLKKTFKEVYKKKRGSASEEFDGHTIDYFIDGVPVKEKEYTTTIENLCGSVENLKMLTMPDYFSETMSWDERRRILLDICGDISDEEIIALNSELTGLIDFLRIPGANGHCYSVDEYKKIASAKKTDINKQLAEIPSRIDEAQRAMPDITEINAALTQATIDGLIKNLAELNERKHMAVMGDTAVLRKEIAEAETTLTEARAAFMKKASEVRAKIDDELSRAKSEEARIKQELSDSEHDLAMLIKKRDSLKSEREQLLAEYRRVASEVWDDKKAICPTCKRELPETDTEQMKSEFNLQRSRRLEEINQKGSECSREKIEVLDTIIAKTQTKISELQQQLQEAHQRSEEVAKLQNAIQTRFEDTPEFGELNRRVQELRRGLDTQSATEALRQLDERIQAITASITAERSKLLKLETAKMQANRIAELEQQEQRLAAEYEELNRGIYLCELFIKTKVSALTERINSRFKSVRFRLFVEQLNGGIKEDCEVMIPTSDGRLVPYSFANNAARINAGLEIIATLGEHLNAAMPVFIDNAESVTRIEPVSAQVIRLVVSEADKTLRLEINK